MKQRGGRNYLFKSNGTRYESHSIRAFLNHVRTINWQKSPLVYLRVSERGKQNDVFGIMQTFYNDGGYATKKDFMQAFAAFCE